MLTEKDREKLASLGQSSAWRARVNLMCKECIYDPLAGGTWLQQVRECTCSGCPLYGVRPK